MSRVEEEEKTSLPEASSVESPIICKGENSSNLFCDETNNETENVEINDVNCHGSFSQDEVLNKNFPYQNGEDCRSDTEDGEEKTKVNGDDICVKSEPEFEERDNVNSEALSETTQKEPCQVLLTPEHLLTLNSEEFVEKWYLQNEYITFLHSKLDSAVQQVSALKESQSSDERLKTQIADLQRKEQYYVMRLATKEQEVQELGAQVDELKALTAGGNNLKHSLLDPAVNLLFERMKRDLDGAKTKMEETQHELAAWKFTPDSNTGKQLMAKCRLLIKENEELGKMISSGKLAKLEGDLALQRNFSDELKKSQSELDEFLQEMDEDTEGMQGTILYLQSQLRQAKERLAQLSIQGTSNNNTPASMGEVPEYSEGFSSDIGAQQGGDTLLQCIDQERTRYPTPDSLFKESDRLEDNSSGVQSNSGILTDINTALGCEESENACSQFNNSSDRKRTQSDLDESGGGDSMEHIGEEGTSQDVVTEPLVKRTRSERTASDVDRGSSEEILENGLPME